LTTAKSAVTILEPENPAELKGAASEWGLSEANGEFNPKIKLHTRQMEIMRFDRGAIIGATVEAVLRSWPGQSPWHVTHWRQSGSTVHVAVIGGAWAGVSYYGTEVSFLIEKSVLRLPGVTRLIFER